MSLSRKHLLSVKRAKRSPRLFLLWPRWSSLHVSHAVDKHGKHLLHPRAVSAAAAPEVPWEACVHVPVVDPRVRFQKGLLNIGSSSFLLLVAMPFVTSSFLLLVVMPGATASFLLLVAVSDIA